MGRELGLLGWGIVPGYPGLDPCPAGLSSGTVVDAQPTPPAPNDKEDPQGALRQPLLLPPPGLLGGASVCVSPAGAQVVGSKAATSLSQQSIPRPC